MKKFTKKKKKVMMLSGGLVLILSIGAMTLTSFAHGNEGYDCGGDINKCCKCCYIMRKILNQYHMDVDIDNDDRSITEAPVEQVTPETTNNPVVTISPIESATPVQQNPVVTISPVESANPTQQLTATAQPINDNSNSEQGNVGKYFTAIDKIDHKGQFDYYLENASSTDKSMKMVASKNGNSPQWKTAAFVSKQAYRYGTYEFTYRLSANDIYLWPMIWILPDDESGTNKIARPEFDLLEAWGSYTGNNHVISTHVYTGNNQPKMFQKQVKVDLTKQHTIKLDWQRDKVEYYLDGTKQLTVTEGLKDYYEVFIISLGVGTYDGKAPNGEGWFEITDFKMNPTETREKHLKYW